MSIVGDFTDSTVSFRKIVSQAGSMLGRSFSRMFSSVPPSYTFTLAKPNVKEDYDVLINAITEKKVKHIIEHEYEFTTEDVRAMITRMQSCHVVGKLVVNINANPHLEE